MPDWDEDSKELLQNLKDAYRNSRDCARRRDVPSVNLAREWHRITMRKLTSPGDSFVGSFRGGEGLVGIEVYVGSQQGVASASVNAELLKFERKLQAATEALDKQIVEGSHPNTADEVNAVIELCAWAHAEWVRIHPFVNGNGRIARIWTGYIAMRYGLPPFVRLRSRPDDGYGLACNKAMSGDWQPTARIFRQLYIEALSPE